MGIGTFLLNWGVLVVGLILFVFGQFHFSFYVKAYRRHVSQYGRCSVGKEYGTSWTKEDERGMVLARSFWTVGALAIPGALLYFFTPLAEIGLPLHIGCTLAIAGIFLVFFAYTSGAGLAKREVEIVFDHMLEAEQRNAESIRPLTEEVSCIKCGSQNPSRYQFCGKCGAELPQSFSKPP